MHIRISGVTFVAEKHQAIYGNMKIKISWFTKGIRIVLSTLLLSIIYTTSFSQDGEKLFKPNMEKSQK